MRTMRRLAASVVVVSVLSFPLSAQERNSSLERISLALQQPPPILRGGAPLDPPLPGALKVGPFTLETPQLRGEIIRLSLPVGEYVSRVARGLATANHRRKETAARRRVEADLKAFAERQSPQ